MPNWPGEFCYSHSCHIPSWGSLNNIKLTELTAALWTRSSPKWTLSSPFWSPGGALSSNFPPSLPTALTNCWEKEHNAGGTSSPSAVKASLGSVWGWTVTEPLLEQPDSKCPLRFREQVPAGFTEWWNSSKLKWKRSRSVVSDSLQPRGL